MYVCDGAFTVLYCVRFYYIYRAVIQKCASLLQKPYNQRMYHEYFGLTEAPFSIAPDPRYLYMSERHREALAHLVYGLNSDGAFILLTGDVGTGKTTVSRCLLEQIPDDTNLALVLNPKVSARELLQTICDELHIYYCKDSGSIKDHVDLLNGYLLNSHAQGKKTVVLIEEAQNLDLDVLEQLRLLTNLETNERKLLQIILLGQPEFLHVLDRPELSQLSQRITARYHLKPLNYEEMLSYVGHRLAVAGCRRPLFKKMVLKRLYKISHGIPRVINVICDRALLGAYVQNKSQVDNKTLDNAAKEVLGEGALDKMLKPESRIRATGKMTSIAAALLMLAVAMQYYFYSQDESSLTQAPEADTAIVKAEPVNRQPNENKNLAQPVWPDDTTRLRSNSLAYQTIFSNWKINYNPEINGSPCFFAQSNGLSCLKGNGNFKDIRELNRPAVLQLKDNQGQIYYATLTGLGHDIVTLVMASKEQVWSHDQLLQHWFGNFTLLWRQPPGYQDLIRPGDEGVDVIWLSQKINQIDKSNEIPEVSVYQEKLIEKIRRFQIKQGLVADGIVGVETLIRINNLTRLDVPVLNKNG